MDILVKNLDINLLKEQRDMLIEMQEKNYIDEIEGIINLFDYMIDVAEGEE